MKSPYNGQTLPSQGAICQINGPTDGRALIDWEAGTSTPQIMSVAHLDRTGYHNVRKFGWKFGSYRDLDKARQQTITTMLPIRHHELANI